MKINAYEKGVKAGAGEAVVGASMVDAANGEVLEIANGIVIVEAAAAIEAGAEVQSDTNGKAVTKTTGIAAGIAMTKASGSGALVSVLIR